MAEPHTPDESVFGVLRIKAGPDGGAVRLGVLVRDLMKRHDMARAEAVTDLLLPRLQGNSPPTLYVLQPGGNALGLGDREWFQTGTGNPPPRPLFKPIFSPPPLVSLGHGTAGAVAWLHLAWADSKYADEGMDVREALGSFLAVSEADAAAVWGWGASRAVALRVVGHTPTLKAEDFETMAARRKGYKDRNEARPRWSDAEKDLVVGEADRLHKRQGAAASMAAALGVTVERVNGLVRERKKETVSTKNARRTV